MNCVFDGLWHHARTRPDDIAFELGQTRVGWGLLAARVASGASALASAPATIGLALANGPDYVVADLAATLAGKTLVPIPHFFGPDQIAHIIRDAGIEAMIGGGEGPLPRLDAAVLTPPPRRSRPRRPARHPGTGRWPSCLATAGLSIPRGRQAGPRG